MNARTPANGWLCSKSVTAAATRRLRRTPLLGSWRSSKPRLREQFGRDGVESATPHSNPRSRSDSTMARTDCTPSRPSWSIPGYGARTAEDCHSFIRSRLSTGSEPKSAPTRPCSTAPALPPEAPTPTSPTPISTAGLVGTAGQELTALQALIEGSITPTAAARRGTDRPSTPHPSPGAAGKGDATSRKDSHVNRIDTVPGGVRRTR